MRNLPTNLRADLTKKFLDLARTANVVEVSGETPNTRKLLLRLNDSQHVETVVIPSRDRNTVCVSSQAGCAFGCAFCASGKAGWARDLEPGEIVAQVIRAAQVIGGRPDNIVFMGIGEPFANYDAVLRAVRTINAAEGLGIGARHITISTCGVVPGIQRLAREGLQVGLSVSLHAATDSQRSEIMPVNQRWPLAELRRACEAHIAATNRIITFEYTMVAGFNDRPSDVEALAHFIGNLKCHVNLIPLSPIAEFDGRPPSARVQDAFQTALLNRGVNATLRRSRGARIDAACGQLRLRRLA